MLNLIKRYLAISDIFWVTVIIFFCVKSFYKITTAALDPIYIASNPEKPAVYAKDEAFQPLSFYKIIIDRNLFKTKTKAQEAAAKEQQQIDVETLKQTELKLKLWGTVTGDPASAYAIIEDAKDKQQNLYRVSDNIQNATVKAILRKKVVLSVNGKDEVLEMEDEDVHNNQSKKITSDLKTKKVEKIEGESESNADGPSEATIRREQLNEAIKDSNNLMQQARILPHYVNGKPDGIVLTNIHPKSVFRNAGLRNRDIITGINGKSISSMEDAAKLYENLATASNMSLQIKRRGEQKNLELKIE